MLLAIVIGVVFVLSGVFLSVIGRTAELPSVERHRKRQDRPARIAPEDHRRSVNANSAVSSVLLFGGPLALQRWLFVSEPVGPLRLVAEAAAILAVYDFAYYLYHRFALHEWSVGRRIHSVHHRVRAPYARDSLYIHPLETLGGVVLFLGSAAIVGPVAVWSYGLAFLVYSLLNIFIHSGIDIRVFPFRTVTALVRNHDVHHDSMKSGYYASITPVWDWVFRTAGPPRHRADGSS